MDASFCFVLFYFSFFFLVLLLLPLLFCFSVWFRFSDTWRYNAVYLCFFLLFYLKKGPPLLQLPLLSYTNRPRNALLLLQLLLLIMLSVSFSLFFSVLNFCIAFVVGFCWWLFSFCLLLKLFIFVIVAAAAVAVCHHRNCFVFLVRISRTRCAYMYVKYSRV